MDSNFAQDADVREFAGGVAAGDYNNDGFVDLFIVRGDIGPNLLYRNKGDSTFRGRRRRGRFGLHQVHN